MKTLLLPFFFFCFLLSAAQKKNASYELIIKKINTPILIDGRLQEDAWKDAAIAGNFYMALPMDTSYAKVRTDVRMAFDDNNLYLIAECFHAVPGPYYVESLRRDFVFGKNDNFLLFMDPFDDQTNGFSFGANAAGAQWDGTMNSGGAVDLNWDNKWNSAVIYDSVKWTLEMAIPFTTIRFKKGITKWGINFSRLDLKTTEKSSWAPVPRQFPTAALAYTGYLVWETPPPSPGTNISIIPYVLGGVSKNHETFQDLKWQKKIGADLKIGVTSSLNLDITINPDFSQVEVDRQVTNLERFELFFPERRQFFLENGDIFANFGYASLRPFFSRRIGLGVPIRAGARLSGNLNKDWRIGVMNMQTARQSESYLPEQNFTVLSLQRRVFSRSNIGFLFVNKQSLRYNKPVDSPAIQYSLYNRNIGLEYKLASASNIWTGKAFVLKSFSPGLRGRDFVQAADLLFNHRKWNIFMLEEYVGKNYNAEVGYVPRNGYIKLNPGIGRLFFPKRTKILSHGPRLNVLYYFDESFSQTDHLNILSYTFNFRSQSVFTFSLVDEYIKLLRPFDPTNLGNFTLPTGSEHKLNAWQAQFTSKPQSVFTYGFNSRLGKYYAEGKRININAEAGYRFQPYVKILVNGSYNYIELPSPWNVNTFWLVGSQLDITFTNKLFFSTFFQYNQQLKNINVNSRFQWRYKPASDLFLVYTDNYYPSPFLVRNRALVLKLNYWWSK